MTERTTGRPASPNGASSFHCWWVGADAAREISVVLSVEQPPDTDDLHFWALQVGFADGSRPTGGAHLGLQWNARHPRSRAVNWGGYRPDGTMLTGARSGLPSAPGDPNTRDLAWDPGRRYRLTVRPGDERGTWRGEVTGLDDELDVVVRTLSGGGDRLVDPVVWSEVFAPCDAPSVSVRWTDPVIVDAAGAVSRPLGYRVSYQTVERGGCSNTDVVVGDGRGVRQVTNRPRTTPDGEIVRSV